MLLTYDFYDLPELAAVRAIAGEAAIVGRLPITLSPRLFEPAMASTGPHGSPEDRPRIANSDRSRPISNSDSYAVAGTACCARLAEMGDAPDHRQLAAEVLGIRARRPSSPSGSSRRRWCVEDRREVWRAAGERICRDAPPTPGVYVLRDAAGRRYMSARR